MFNYLNAVSYSLIVLILYLLLSGQSKNMAVLLSIAACCGIFVICAEFLGPVLDFWHNLSAESSWDPQLMQILLKAVGLGLISEYITLICNDAGNTALGRALQMLTCGAILYISLPLFHSLMDMLNTILSDS